MCDCESKSCKTSSTLPSWLHRPLIHEKISTKSLLRKCGLCTVCEESLCPNLPECYGNGRATFLLLGPSCTRCCAFCHVHHTQSPKPPDPEEPTKVADACALLSLDHVVITMVSRDDLSDGGATHMASTIREIRKKCPSTTVEILSSDFSGSSAAISIVLKEAPEVFAHNIETVQSLSPKIRSKATYQGSLSFLTFLKKARPSQVTKSGLMVGLGETKEEVVLALKDLVAAKVDIVTIGQYLQPSSKQVAVQEWIHPELFQEYTSIGHNLGISQVIAGPFVRSSYHAKPLHK